MNIRSMISNIFREKAKNTAELTRAKLLNGYSNDFVHGTEMLMTMRQAEIALIRLPDMPGSFTQNTSSEKTV